ncbi:MAG: transmembrane prediction [Myxococcales bacterium]|nr:transmembrane prediction [Myxococcales bacterium]
MKIPRALTSTVIISAVLLGSLVLAQRNRGDFGRGSLEDSYRNGVPDWQVKDHMPDDVFTFVRIKFDSEGWGWGRRGGKWRTDYPDSDLNFSYRLQELTSMEVNPDGKVLELTEPELFDYPFIYMIEPGSIWLSDDEIKALRKYLLNGGFLMVDDFWGDREWDHFEKAFKYVFPDREFEELELEHPIFHCVFDLQEKPQVPALQQALQGRDAGVTWEWGKKGSEKVSYKQMKDDKGRMMCVVCFNTDLGDGWEREGESRWYFKEFSEKKAYPMGVNIVFYALTH